MLHGFLGSMGGVASSVVFQPLDVVKTRQQQGLSSSTASQRGMLTTATTIVRFEGVRALWRGTMPTVYRTLPGSTMYFAMLRAMQTAMATLNRRPSLGDPTADHRRYQTLVNLQNATAGATARAISGILLNPVSVVKARYESNLYPYKSTWDALATITRTEGIRGAVFRFSFFVCMC